MAGANRFGHETQKQRVDGLEKFAFGSLKTLRNIVDDINNYLPEILPG